MRKIIIPVDFSENSWNALKCAIQYFKYERTDFFIVHAYADEVYENKSLISHELLEEYKKSVNAKATKSLKALHEKILAYFPDPRHTYTMMTRFGILLDELNDISNQENADCIVMGTHGKSNNRKITFGSQTIQVLKYVKCPVLAIPHKFEYTRPETIVFPTDLMMPYKRRELKLLSCLALSYRSKVKLLYISGVQKLSLRQEDNKALIEDSFRESELSFHTPSNTNITDGIQAFIKEDKGNFLVMVNSKHSYMESFLVSSKIDEMGLHAEIPFLVLQNLPRS